ncbi:MAG: polysaccharide biosynthesis/export family protein, partial [Lentisphaeria bacterium]|nr:polysaccharide biosynthesis/export family protein [Lentisphaeria bacterium]NQZ70414.1 polysaccharide biosynthesis/export family protein [Lentisphaeria bacterium]
MNKISIVYLCLICSMLAETRKDKIIISHGDTVNVSMKEDQEVKFEGEVSTNGFVTIPYLGAIKISNLTEEKAEVLLKTALEKELYQKATLSV